MMIRILSGLTAVWLIASATHVEAQGLYRKDQFTVKDLHWCLDARPPPIDSPCMHYLLGVADLVRVGEVRFKDKPICWPEGEPMTRIRVFDIVMNRDRLNKWDPGTPAVSAAAAALAEAFPCDK